MKFLLIPFLMFAAAFTANAHCGACGTEAAHAEKKACAKGCEKACCTKAESSDKKACAKGCEKACCTEKMVEPKVKAEVKATSALAAPLMPCCAKSK